MPNQKPILFNTEMVQATQAGLKTQTRRVMKLPVPTDEWKSVYQDGGGNWIAWEWDGPDLAEFTQKTYPNGEGIKCPYGKPGDSLWVRETWQAQNLEGQWWHEVEKKERELHNWAIIDRASPNPDLPIPPRWIPSIFMPRWASRFNLTVLDVRVERVQDITTADTKREGVDIDEYMKTHSEGEIFIHPFASLWDSINAKRDDGVYSWASNPWVWVVEFELQ